MDLRILNPRALNEQRFVAVAVDRDKGSQHAFRWAADNLLWKGQTVTLIHVNQIPSPRASPLESNDISEGQEPNDQSQDLFLPFRVFCSCKEVTCDPVTIEDNDVAKALIEYVSLYRIESLVMGASSRNGISRLFNKNDIPTTVLKGAPDFCNVFIISKGKVNSNRPASRPLRSLSALRRLPLEQRNFNNDEINIMSPYPFSRIHTTENRMPDEVLMPRGDFCFATSGRLSPDNMFLSFYDNLEAQPSRQASKHSSVDGEHMEPFLPGSKLADLNYPAKYAYVYSQENMHASERENKTKPLSSEKIADMEEKMRRLELQMNQTMEMYHAACKEALKEKQKAKELQLLRKEDERKLAEALWAKDEAVVLAEKEKALRITATEAAKVAQRKAEKETQKRKAAEKELLREVETTKMMLNSLDNSQTAIKYQSLLRVLVVFIIFYFYFFELE